MLAGNRIKYICTECEKIVSKEVGVENIDDKYKMKVAINKNTSDKDNTDEIFANPIEVNVVIDNEEEADNDDDEDLENDKTFAKAKTELRG